MTRHLFIHLAGIVLAVAPAALAEPGDNQLAAPGANGPQVGAHRAVAPDYHDVERDGPVYMTRDASGGLWAAWSYHSGANVDIAVSRVVGTTWTAPRLIGSGNNVADLDPRLLLLEDGTGLVVWWQRPDDGAPSRVMSSTLTDDEWDEPQQLSPGLLPARSPTFFDTESGEPLIGYVVENPDGSSSVVTTPARRPPRADGGTNGPDPIPTIGDKPDEESEGWARRARRQDDD